MYKKNIRTTWGIEFWYILCTCRYLHNMLRGSVICYLWQTMTQFFQPSLRFCRPCWRSCAWRSSRKTWRPWAWRVRQTWPIWRRLTKIMCRNWGFPARHGGTQQLDGLYWFISWKTPWKWMMNRGTPIAGNLQMVGMRRGEYGWFSSHPS